MKNFSRIYLHFFDRELCIASNSYSISTSSFVEVFQIISIFSYENMYCSGGHLFEHKGCRAVFSKWPEIFYNGDLKIVSKKDNLYDFVESKKNMYSHLKSDPEARDYGVYFDNEWERHINGPVSFISPPSNYDTTTELEAKLASGEFINDIDSRKIYLDTLMDRGVSAITTPLFQKNNKLSQNIIRPISWSISRNYNNIYSNQFDGTIFHNTGIVAPHLENFQQMIFDYRLFKRVYQYFGFNQIINVTGSEWTYIRGINEHVRFVNYIREMLSQIRSDDFHLMYDFFNKIFDSDYTYNQNLLSMGDLFYKINNRLYDFDPKSISSATEYNSKYYKKIGESSVSNKIFVVYGHDEKAKKSLFAMLRAMGLEPLEFQQIINSDSDPSPYIGEAIDKAMNESNAVLVLFTPDEQVCIKKELTNGNGENQLRYQSRPNVFYEAGMAMAKSTEKTIIVRMGDAYIPSDIAGRHYTSLDNSSQKKLELKARLEKTGYVIDSNKSDWIDCDIEYTKSSERNENGERVRNFPS